MDYMLNIRLLENRICFKSELQETPDTYVIITLLIKLYPWKKYLGAPLLIRE